MSDSVHVAFGDNQAETASALLAAAEALDLDAGVVKVNTEHQTFEVPEEVAKKAKLETHEPNAEQILAVSDAIDEAAEADEPDPEASTKATPDPQAGQDMVGGIDPGPSAEKADAEQLEAIPHTTPAKKAAAKRPAKKAAAKKTTTKKAAAKKAPAKTQEG